MVLIYLTSLVNIGYEVNNTSCMILAITAISPRLNMVSLKQ
jgi:hypothetical protein